MYQGVITRVSESRNNSIVQHVFILAVVAGISVLIYNAGKEYVSVSHPSASITVDYGFMTMLADGLPPSELSYGKNIFLDESNSLPSSKNRAKAEGEVVWITSLVELITPPDRIWSIYMPYSSFKFQFYVNGLELADIGSATSTGAHHGSSFLVSIPNGVLKPGLNEVQLRLTRYGESMDVLVPSYLMGPLSEIAPFYLSQNLFSETLPKTVITLLCVFGMALFLVWMTSGNDRIYLALSACSFLWAGHLVTQLPGVDMFLRHELLTGLSSIVLIAFALSLIYLSVAFTSAKMGTYPVICVLLGGGILFVAIVAIDLLFGVMKNFPNYMLVLPLLFLITCGVLILLIQQQEMSVSAYVILSIMLLLFFQITDQFVAPQTSVRSSYSPLQFVAMPFILTVVVKLVRDFIKSKRTLEIINANLEQIVRDRTEKIESEMIERKRVEQEKMLADERNRLMMEMHDGLGARLVGLISQIDTSAEAPSPRTVRNELKDSLDELRLVVDSMNPIEGDLISVLAMFRQRLQKSLDGAEKKLIWNVDDLPLVDDLSPEKTLNILRILQEATANAIKYSAGSTVSIAARAMENDRVSIVVSDDGGGFVVDKKSCGQGLRNMAKRAEKIGADIEFRNSVNGFSVDINFAASRNAAVSAPGRPVGKTAYNRVPTIPDLTTQIGFGFGVVV